MPILERIREQPQHVREIMFGLSVVITVSMVGAFWFRGFQTNLYALLNSEEAVQERVLASENTGSDSLFSVLGKTLGDITSTLTGFWGTNDSITPSGAGLENKPSDRVYLLPLSEQK